MRLLKEGLSCKRACLRVAAAAAVALSGGCGIAMVDAAGSVPTALTRTYEGDSEPGCSIESIMGPAGTGAEMHWTVERQGGGRVDVTGWGTLPKAEEACEKSGLPRDREGDRVMGVDE